MIIAIDGFAASGKGILAEFLAEHYKCEFLSTGNLYRVVAKGLIEKGVNIEKFVLSPWKIDLMGILNKENILDANLVDSDISKAASRLATVNMVRKVLTKFQQEWIKKRKMAIVEGRDIGTVVWPKAEVKLFLVADPKIRAKRRACQLRERGNNVSEKDVYLDLIERDKRDKNRKIAPMKQAKDAILLDTTKLTIKEMEIKALQLIEKKIDGETITV